MSLAISITEQNVYNALGSFLKAILPSGVVVQQSQVNRVAEPNVPDFVLMTSNGFHRQSTNVDATADALFTGAISGATLTIATVISGAINVGSPVFGLGIAVGTVVTALGTGTGGVGTYTVSPGGQTVASEEIAAGTKQILMPSRMTVQLDVHGPLSADNASRIEAAFRDQYGVDLFKASGFDVAPLYTSEARQLPFLNDSQQIEQRWVIDAELQINQIAIVPQQYADAVNVGLIEVDAVYPP